MQREPQHITTERHRDASASRIGILQSENAAYLRAYVGESRTHRSGLLWYLCLRSQAVVLFSESNVDIIPNFEMPGRISSIVAPISSSRNQQFWN